MTDEEKQPTFTRCVIKTSVYNYKCAFWGVACIGAFALICACAYTIGTLTAPFVVSAGTAIYNFSATIPVWAYVVIAFIVAPVIAAIIECVDKRSRKPALESLEEETRQV